MTSVTSKIRSTPSLNVVFAMLWYFCVPNLVRTHQIFLQILIWNYLFHAVALNDLCDLENKVEVTRLELGLHLALELLCTKFGEDTFVIFSGNHLAYAMRWYNMSHFSNGRKKTACQPIYDDYMHAWWHHMIASQLCNYLYIVKCNTTCIIHLSNKHHQYSETYCSGRHDKYP